MNPRFLLALVPCCLALSGCGQLLSRADTTAPAASPASLPVTPQAAATPLPVTVLSSLKAADARLDESSGLAASRRYPGDLWTHNDSGGQPEAYLLNSQAQTVATVRLTGAKNLDWEDMAWRDGWLYCADIGDNNRTRPTVPVYRLSEPKLDPGKRDQTLATVPEQMWLRYPGDPQDAPHDAETLIVLPDARLLIASKSIVGSEFFITPKPFQNGIEQTLERIGDFGFEGGFGQIRGVLATGGDLSPDGKKLTIITYSHLWEWDVPSGADAWKQVWKTKPRAFSLPKARQIEAVCYAADGQSLWVSSEGKPMPLAQLMLK